MLLISIYLYRKNHNPINYMDKLEEINFNNKTLYYDSSDEKHQDKII